jgi:hypothetical protein
MTMPMQLEYEDEFGHDGEFESEEFFRGLADLAARAAASPTLRRIGLTAARRVIAGIPLAAGATSGPDLGWSDLRRSTAGTANQHLRSRSSRPPAREYEWESDGEFEVNPLAKIYPAALMEHLGRAAAEATNEAEAEAFAGALVPLAARLIPRVAPAILRSAPQLIRGVSSVTRLLRANPSTRPLVRTVPAILHQTAQSLASQSAAGQSPTAQRAVRTLANQTARILSDPGQGVRAYQRSQALVRRYPQNVGR